MAMMPGVTRKAVLARSPEFLYRLNSDLGKRHADCTLDSYTCRERGFEDHQRRVLDTVRETIGDPELFMREGGNLIFYGRPGTGKDHLMVAILREFASTGLSARYTNAQEWIVKARDRIARSAGEMAHVAPLLEPHVLGLSDPVPARRDLSGYNIDMLYVLVNQRWFRRLPTFITVNAEDEDQMRRKLSEPVFDRLADGATMFEMKWPTYRKPKRIVR